MCSSSARRRGRSSPRRPPSSSRSRARRFAVEGSKIWIGREAEFEAFLKQAKVERVDDVPVGVTKPKRAFVTPGGLAGSFVFKELMPSRKTGFFESYKSEIAAYELDKILGMGMVPPTVERKHDGVTGSAQLWVEHCSLLRDNDTTKAPDPGRLEQAGVPAARVGQPDGQHRPQPGEPADGPGVEPDPDRSLAGVHRRR